MAFSAKLHPISPPSLGFSCKSRRPFSPHYAYFLKPLTIRASTTLDYSQPSSVATSSTPLKVLYTRLTMYSNIGLVFMFEIHMDVLTCCPFFLNDEPRVIGSVKMGVESFSCLVFGVQFYKTLLFMGFDLLVSISSSYKQFESTNFCMLVL